VASPTATLKREKTDRTSPSPDQFTKLKEEQVQCGRGNSPPEILDFGKEKKTRGGWAAVIERDDQRAGHRAKAPLDGVLRGKRAHE